MWPLWVRHRLMRCADVLGQGIYRASGGLIGERQWTFHMLLLDSIGRKSGKTRTHTLLFFRDGERFIVVASNFAGPKQPAWYWNLRDHPHAHIQVGRNRLNVAVTEAEGEERNRLWQMALTAYAKYAVYQQQTSRRIPVMVLTPEPTTPNLSPDQHHPVAELRPGPAWWQQWQAQVQPHHPRWGPVLTALAAVWRWMRWAWGNFVIGGVVITALISLAVFGALGFPPPQHWALFRFLGTHLLFTTAFLLLLVLLSAIAFGADRILRAAPPLTNVTAEYVLERLDRLDPADYIPRYVPVYLSRLDPLTGADIDQLSRDVLSQAGRSSLTSRPASIGICIWGRPTAGKTRLAWEAMRATLPDWTFVRWPNDPDTPFDFAAQHGKRLVVWLDDLHEYANPTESPLLNDLPRRIMAMGARVVVVATCRDGDDELRTRAQLSRLLEQLTSIRLGDISQEEAHSLADGLTHEGVEVSLDQFDQTPGSLLLGVQRMRDQRYPALPEPARGILRAMKLLRSVQIYNYPEARVSATSADLFGVAAPDWTHARDTVLREGFARLTDDGDLEPVADVYLERAVPDYPAPGGEMTRDWPALQESLMRHQDADGLTNLGLALEQHAEASQANLQQARLCFQGALRYYSRDYTPEEWANTQDYLGRVTLKLAVQAQGEERVDLLEAALDATRAALRQKSALSS